MRRPFRSWQRPGTSLRAKVEALVTLHVHPAPWGWFTPMLCECGNHVTRGAYEKSSQTMYYACDRCAMPSFVGPAHEVEGANIFRRIDRALKGGELRGERA